MANSQNTSNIDEVIFEERDIQIFSIPDTKNKLATLQNYFFPRLEILLRYTLDIVAQVYDLNPYETMTFVYCPNHREKAKENKDYGIVHIGVGAKRRRDRPLRIIKRDGKPFVLHVSYLTFKVLPNGTMYVDLLPFRQYVDDAYIAEIAALIEKHSKILLPLLSLTHISYGSFLPLHESINPENSYIRFVSPSYYFPLDSGRGFTELIIAFVLLYALEESFIRIAEGEEPDLERMLDQFKEWYVYIRDNEDNYENKDIDNEDITLEEIPELDSYSFVRAGKWWAVLARDQWKCLSCGRSAREDGVLLEVDHIIPRSKGGSDEMSNLQTLCKKCNIGKSNKDTTRL
ncbi:HNH endonuclease [Tumidithrix helvetica PCC 7403]|uniref:HNH endonuclease n=1 Tax=Tumidithrix helvetica TaxID=3457545 RepID=UPI003CA06E08